MKMRSQWLIWSIALALPVGLVAQERTADRKADAPAAKQSKAWKPDTDGREDFREIVELNIFRPDRSALAGQQDRDNNPPPVVVRDDPTPAPIVPTDPDRSRVLVGMSLRSGTCYAFIEDRKSGETVRVAVPGEYAQGTLSAGTVDGLTYTLDDGGEVRELLLGQTFTGELAPRASSIARNPIGVAPSAPADSPTPNEPGADAPAPPASSGDLSELERRLRERRQRGE